MFQLFNFLCLAFVANGFFFQNPLSKIGLSQGKPATMPKTVMDEGIPSWDDLETASIATSIGQFMQEQKTSWLTGEGLPHTDAKLRLFRSKDEPRVLFYRDTAAWCPYCQKVWILLEEKEIPYRIEKINMRSYGDKPAEFLRMVPNGLLPAIVLDGKMQTDSLAIMLNLDRTFTGPKHKPMLPPPGSSDMKRAEMLLQLERQLFSTWCNLVFRPQAGTSARTRFERDLDQVDRELTVTSSPWFLNDFSLVDLTYVSHVERMCASVAYWGGFSIRGNGRWPALERWLDAFEQLPSYMATKSDYYTHIRDIPPQYGPGYRVDGVDAVALGNRIDGQDGSWRLPLPAFRPDDVEPVSPAIDPGEEASRHEAAYKLIGNHDAIVKFALRGAGSPGSKRFQAPLADPYAVPNMDYAEDMSVCLRLVALALLSGHTEAPRLGKPDGGLNPTVRDGLAVSLAYLRDRVGVPRDMSYPAARQLRAHLNWVIDQL